MKLKGRRPRTRLKGAGFALLCAMLLLVTRGFQYFPGFGPIQEVAFLLPLLVFVPVVLHLRPQIPMHQRWTLFDSYAIGLMMLMPIWSGLMAQVVHGQPWYFGVLALRGYGTITVALLMLNLLRAGTISLQDVDRALLTCAWLSFALFVLMTLTLDPANFADEGNTFVEDRMDEGMRFKFSNALLLYALFSHGVRAMRRSNWKHLLPLGILLIWLIGSAGGRILTLGILLTTLVMLALMGNLRTVLSGVATLAAAIGLAVAIGLTVDGQATQDRLAKFGDAFSVLAADADVIDDVSAASRVLQTVIAWPYIEESPWFGTGRVSAQWIDGGYKGLMGEHFFPDDIGGIGMLMQFGGVGTLLIYGQFVFALVMLARWKKRDRGRKVDDITLTFAAYAVYEALASLANADAMMFPEWTLIIVAMLVHAGQASSDSLREEATPRRSRRQPIEPAQRPIDANPAPG